jgi:hypothetical protein
MKQWLAQLTLAVLLAAPSWAANPQSQPSRRPYQTRDTWYEFMLKQFNKDNVDYGPWFERRRQAFLDATIRNAYFDYSLLATVALLFAICAYAKLWMDGRRKMLVTAEMMTDILNQERYSREAARLAIEKYNRHIELCNRAIEAGDMGDAQMVSASEVTGLRAELEHVATDLATAARERDKATEELAQKSTVIAEMSLRIDALSKKFDGNGSNGQTINIQGSNVELVAHINRLQQELYVERQKNKRLKGA